jgi:hypothetical protein
MINIEADESSPHYRCCRCGYVLAHLNPRGECPECGLAIRFTIAASKRHVNLIAPIVLTAITILVLIVGIVFNGMYEPFFEVEPIGLLTQLLVPSVMIALWIRWLLSLVRGRYLRSHSQAVLFGLWCAAGTAIAAVCPFLYWCDLSG